MTQSGKHDVSLATMKIFSWIREWSYGLYKVADGRRRGCVDFGSVGFLSSCDSKNSLKIKSAKSCFIADRYQSFFFCVILFIFIRHTANPECHLIYREFPFKMWVPHLTLNSSSTNSKIVSRIAFRQICKNPLDLGKGVEWRWRVASNVD